MSKATASYWLALAIIALSAVGRAAETAKSDEEAKQQADLQFDESGKLPLLTLPKGYKAERPAMGSLGTAPLNITDAQDKLPLLPIPSPAPARRAGPNVLEGLIGSLIGSAIGSHVFVNVFTPMFSAQPLLIPIVAAIFGMSMGTRMAMPMAMLIRRRWPMIVMPLLLGAVCFLIPPMGGAIWGMMILGPLFARLLAKLGSLKK